jgi:hypothetical protein
MQFLTALLLLLFLFPLCQAVINPKFVFLYKDENAACYRPQKFLKPVLCFPLIDFKDGIAPTLIEIVPYQPAEVIISTTQTIMSSTTITSNEVTTITRKFREKNLNIIVTFKATLSSSTFGGINS